MSRKRGKKQDTKESLNSWEKFNTKALSILFRQGLFLCPFLSSANWQAIFFRFFKSRMCILPSPARSNEAHFTKIEKGEKSFEKQGGKIRFLKELVKGYLSLQNIFETPSKSPDFCPYIVRNKIFLWFFPVLPQNWVSISYPFVQMSEGINLFSQLGCPFGLSQ